MIRKPIIPAGFFAAILATILFCAPAMSQMLPGLNGNMLFSGQPPPTVVFGSTAQNNTALSTYTFTGLSTPGPTSTRYIVAAVQVRAATPVISSVTIGGVGATLVRAQSGSLSVAALYIAAVPAGTTNSVVVNLSSGAAIRAQAATWVLDNLTAGGAAETTAAATVSPLALGLTVSSNSVQVATDMDGGGGTTSTWSGSITQNFDTPISGGPNAAGGASGFTLAGGAISITCTIGSASTPSGVSASFK